MVNERIDNMTSKNTRSVPPAPWKSLGVVLTGGLIGVGFAENSDLLLVVTHDGRGVIDCTTGIRVARDRSPDFDFGENDRSVEGVGPLAGTNVCVAGSIYGGALPPVTDDGWVLEGILTNRSDDLIRLLPPTRGEASTDAVTEFTDFVPEVRVFGFSPTGNSFVIGTGADVSVFAR